MHTPIPIAVKPRIRIGSSKATNIPYIKNPTRIKIKPYGIIEGKTGFNEPINNEVKPDPIKNTVIPKLKFPRVVATIKDRPKTITINPQAK